MTAERPLTGIVVRSGVLGGVVLLVTVPVYVYVEAPWRPLVARLAALRAVIAVIERRP